MTFIDKIKYYDNIVLINTLKDSSNLREKTFEEFKKVAKAEQGNGIETLSLFRLVPQFSTAPQEDTNEIVSCMKFWSRKGDGEALVKYGAELFNWARDNGYRHG